MKKLALTFALASAFACPGFAQVAADSQASSSASGNASATAGQNSAALASGTTMGATLNKSVDARHAKVGDQVTAKTTEAVKSDGKVVIPKGSTLVGHVTEATARAKGQSLSSLGIAFDRAILKGGRELPLHAGIQALAASSAVASASANEMEADAMASGGGSAYGHSSASRPGMVGGVGSTVGATAGTVTNTAASVPGSATSAVGSTAGSAAASAHLTSQLTASSTGVIGMPGLALSTQSSTAAQGSVVTSSKQNVHLDGGTQMVLRVDSH
jgi:hypothetical protein